MCSKSVGIGRKMRETNCKWGSYFFKENSQIDFTCAKVYFPLILLKLNYEVTKKFLERPLHSRQTYLHYQN